VTSKPKTVNTRFGTEGAGCLRGEAVEVPPVIESDESTIAIFAAGSVRGGESDVGLDGGDSETNGLLCGDSGRAFSELGPELGKGFPHDTQNRASGNLLRPQKEQYEMAGFWFVFMIHPHRLQGCFS
jgi:hypothetical protein